MQNNKKQIAEFLGRLLAGNKGKISVILSFGGLPSFFFFDKDNKVDQGSKKVQHFSTYKERVKP